MTPVKDTPVNSNKYIEWPKHIKTPSELLQKLGDKTKLQIIRSPQCSKIILQIVGSWSYLLANVFNKKIVFNYEVFQRELKLLESQTAPNVHVETSSKDESNISAQLISRTPNTSPLLTYSNHISCIDDPVLWGALLPLTYYSTQTDVIRWSPAAIDICFSRPWHSTLFCLGKTFPIIRGIGVEQPAMEFALALLKHNQWLHMFPEGRVMRDSNQQVLSNLDRGYMFKWGISKLILDYFKSNKHQIPWNYNDLQTTDTKSIRILPFYHLGLDEILPIGWPYIPRFNKKITIMLRDSVIEMNAKLLEQILSKRWLRSSQMKSRTTDEILRIKLTNYLEDELEKLIEPTKRLHYGIK